jgi:hypothetical protein
MGIDEEIELLKVVGRMLTFLLISSLQQKEMKRLDKSGGSPAGGGVASVPFGVLVRDDRCSNICACRRSRRAPSARTAPVS